MKLKKNMIYIVIIMLFLVYSILIYKFSNGYIANVQAYSYINIMLFIFWVIMILFSIILLKADIGFMKIAAFLLTITGVLVLILEIVNNRSTYEVIKNEEHEIILEIEHSATNDTFTVYVKETALFSLFVDSALVPLYYDTSYDIVGDYFIITKCTENSCVTEEIYLK